MSFCHDRVDGVGILVTARSFWVLGIGWVAY